MPIASGTSTAAHGGASAGHRLCRGASTGKPLDAAAPPTATPRWRPSTSWSPPVEVGTKGRGGAAHELRRPIRDVAKRQRARQTPRFSPVPDAVPYLDI
jgi:hypothetical protein